jgi:hypothetical protein
MAHLSHIHTAARVARILGISEELLEKVSDTMEPGRDGRLSIWHTTDESIRGFTDEGIEYAREILNDPSRMAHILKDLS